MTALLDEQVAHYIAFQQKLGYKFEAQANALRSFTRFAQARKDLFVRTETVLCWANATKGKSQGYRATRLQTVEAFCRWIHAIDARHEIPPRHALGSSSCLRQPPHLISTDSVQQLMAAAFVSND